MGDLAAWKSLLLSPWVVSLVASLASGFVFFLLSRRVPVLAYVLDEHAVLGDPASVVDDQDMEIRFRRRRVPRVTATRFVVWNAGNMTLRGSEIVTSDPLRLHICEPNEVLQADIVRVTRPANGFGVALQADGRSVHINYDFLDRRDGAVVQIVHTSEPGAVGLYGTLRGMPSGPRHAGRNRLSIRRSNEALWVPLSARNLVLMATGLALVLFVSSMGASSMGSSMNATRWFLASVGGGGGFLLGAAVGTRLNRRLRRKFPATLDVNRG